MSLTKAQKGEILQELVEKMKTAKSVVFADYQGTSVKDIKILKKQLRKEGVAFQVAKKTLIKLAAKEVGYESIPDEVLEGPVAAAFSMEDEVAAAKLINQFAKKNQTVKLRGALFDGKVLSVKETKQLATIPSKVELIGKFLYLLKYPVQGFHDVLQNTVAGFVRALNAIKDKKGQAA